MKSTIAIIGIASWLAGCSKEIDVTQSPTYNFSSFAGTVWKTKVKVAIAEIEGYKGDRQLSLLAPRRFDPTAPGYVLQNDAKILAILPEGTVIRIDRFVKDTGPGNTEDVKARLESGSYAQKTVNLDPWLLAPNLYLRGQSSSTNWDVNHEMFEKAEAVKN